MFLLGICLLLAWYGCDSLGEPPPPPPSPSVQGRVVDDVTEFAVEGARVALGDPETGVFFGFVSTSTDGSFEFIVPPAEAIPGRALITLVSKNGYLSNGTDFVLNDDDRVVLRDLRLVPLQPILSVEPLLLDFGTRINNLNLTIKNVGIGGQFDWTITAPNESWLSFESATIGSVSDDSSTVIVNVDRTGLESGIYQGTLPVTTDIAGFKIVEIKFEVRR